MSGPRPESRRANPSAPPRRPVRPRKTRPGKPGGRKPRARTGCDVRRPCSCGSSGGAPGRARAVMPSPKGKLENLGQANEVVGSHGDAEYAFHLNRFRFGERDLERPAEWGAGPERFLTDRKNTRLNSSHLGISYAVFC